MLVRAIVGFPAHLVCRRQTKERLILYCHRTFRKLVEIDLQDLFQTFKQNSKKMSYIWKSQHNHDIKLSHFSFIVSTHTNWYEISDSSRFEQCRSDLQTLLAPSRTSLILGKDI